MTNMKTIENSKPDIACKSVYTALARALLPEVHSTLLEQLAQMPEKESGNNICIIGPGPDALPYIDNLGLLDRVRGNEGKVLFLDYNPAILNVLSGKLRAEGVDNKVISGSERMTSSGVYIAQGDVRHALKRFPGEFDFMDMTVSVHHATTRKADLQSICDDSFAALRPNGKLHVGEGNVDMKYSEAKFDRILADVLDITGVDAAEIRVVDQRVGLDTGREGKVGYMILDENGMVSVGQYSAVGALFGQLCQGLIERGYKQVVGDSGKGVIVPLIDHAMEEDFQGLIVPVRAYYDAIIEGTLCGLETGYVNDFMAAISKERSDAMRGLVEFYSTPELVRDCMSEAGFGIEYFERTNHGPFVNIVGRKIA